MTTEILSGIKEGDDVLVDFTLSGGDNEQGGQQAQNPFMPRPRNNNNKQQNGGGQPQRK
jgi:HlyD family secretion protein